MPTKVALVGASGNLGPAVLNQLLEAGFDVTVLSRQDSNHTFDTRVKVAKVDYESLDSLKNAFSGQEVVVSTLGLRLPRDTHLRLVDAAVAAGVKRFIPSEYGCDTTNPNAAKLPVFGDKVAVQDHLKKASEQSGLSYSFLITGPFLDWGIKNGFLINLSGPVTPLYDGGERKFSATTLSDVGRGIVGIINNLDETKNKAVYISSATLTQKKLLELSGKSDSVETKSVSTADLEKKAYEELSKPNPDLGFSRLFVIRGIYGTGFGGLFDPEKLSNKEFGLKPLSDEDIRGFFN
uniref:ARAD1A09614p n=1 Tax=Blastobotrys adeninivorans TaxID=409370 RepID=A0A060SXI0_BLAAD